MKLLALVSFRADVDGEQDARGSDIQGVIAPDQVAQI